MPSSTPKKLTDYVDNGQVVMTTEGRVNGEDQHRSIRITIDHNKRLLEVIAGYSDDVISQNEQGNSEQAYDTFLRALNYSGFMIRLKNTTYPDDQRGECPLGNRTSYNLTDTDTGDLVSHLWSSTCGSSVGTLGGQVGTLQTLFQAQITDYNTLTSNVIL